MEREPDAEPLQPEDDRFLIDLTGVTLRGDYGTYAVLEKFDAGGMGTVYEGRNPNLGTKVVIKVPHAAFLAQKTFRERFASEIQRLIELAHPHVVRILAQGEHEQVPFFVLDYLPGGSLANRFEALGDQKAHSPTEVLEWLTPIAKTLEFMHTRGVVHRDVKPANILFDDEDHVFLSDFGIAKAIGDSARNDAVTTSGLVIGSPHYSAPEQARGGAVTPAADQYALAATVYEALSGRPPFEGDTPVEILVRKLQQPPDDLASIAPDVPAAASRAVMRALSTEPVDRFESCPAFANALEEAINPPNMVPVASGIPKPPSNRASRVGLGALLVLLVGVFALQMTGAIELFPTSGPEQLTPEESPETTAAAEDGDEKTPAGRTFTYRIPDEITAKYELPFTRAVESAYRKGTFAPDEGEDWALAQKAQAETEALVEQLYEDPALRATLAERLDLRRRIPALNRLHLTGRFADPYLILYASKNFVHEYDLLQILDKRMRDAQREDVRRRQREIRERLAHYARIYQQLYDEWMRRYAEPLMLEPLMSKWGGRPDLTAAKRNFEDGRPLVILLFDSVASFREYRQAKTNMKPPRAGGLNEQEALLVLVDEKDTKDKQFELVKLLHEGAHQLHYWFWRQRNEWKRPSAAEPGLHLGLNEGLAEYWGGFRPSSKTSLVFTGTNAFRLESMQQAAKGLADAKKDYPIFPVKEISRIRSYSQALKFAEARGLHPQIGTELLHQQAWAYLHFLHRHDHGSLKPKFLKFLDLTFFAEVDDPQMAFEDAFGFRSPEDWQDLDEKFQAHVRELLELDPEPFK